MAGGKDVTDKGDGGDSEWRREEVMACRMKWAEVKMDAREREDVG